MKYYKKNLNYFILLAIITGAFAGYLVPEATLSIEILGTLFLRALKLLIIPVIFFSLLVGILNLGESTSVGRIGIKTVFYYLSTTALAVVTGLALVNLFQPGKNIAVPLEAKEAVADGGHSILDVILNIIPENIVNAASSNNILGLIFFTIFLGIAIHKIKNPAKNQVKEMANVFLDALLWMIDIIMLAAPICILSLIGSLVAEFVLQDQLASLGSSLVSYTFTVLSGLAFHGLITLPAFLILFRINPLEFAAGMFPAVTTAFSTASSMATLPITIDCLEKNKVPNRIASFVAPLGGTVNMDGTAIYEAIAVVFIANVYGIDLSLSEQILIFLTATFSAVGAAGTPGAGLVMMIMVLNVVNIPVEGINLIIVVDRILDMFRTAVNVWGDSIGAKIIAKSEQ